MATLKPTDVHLIVQELARQITGQSDISVVDTSSFVSVGNTLMNSYQDETMDALSILIGRTLIASRPYEGRFSLLNALDTGIFTDRLRKISFYSQGTKASGAFNTNLYQNLQDGFTNGQNTEDNVPQSTKSMWEQSPSMPLEMNFAGRSTWQDSITIYEWQVQRAFRDEASFDAFITGAMTEKENDIETQKEAFNQGIILNRIAGQTLATDADESVIDLVAEYNNQFGTSYTRQELLTTYIENWMKFFVATLKTVSKRMEHRTSLYHDPMTKTVNGVEYNVLRHTPLNRQRLMLLSPLFIQAETYVFPTIFNDQFLDIGQYEGVDYWQNINSPASINVTPSVMINGEQKTGENVNLDYVAGVLYDVDGIMTNYQMEAARSTPVEARKGFRNIWWTFAREGINDFTENCVVFTLGEGGSASTVSQTKKK